MHIEQIRDYCLSKPFSSEELPFGPDTLVFKVGGKIFLLIGLDVDGSELRFNVKCDPQLAIEWREKYSQTVFPGYHMNKKHWNTVYANRDLNDDQLYRMIDHSYDLIWQSLPKSIRDTTK